VPGGYVHRIGRTARAGADGIAIAFCAEDERAYLKDIRKITGAELERLPLPDNFRAVVEGVGPTKREQKPKLARPKVTPRFASKGREGEQRPDRPAGEGRRESAHGKPKNKHPSRAGKPRREGEAGPGQPRREGRGEGPGQGRARPQPRPRFGGGRGRG